MRLRVIPGYRRSQFEGKSQGRDSLSFQVPQCIPYLTGEPLDLFFINANYFVEQSELESELLGDGAKRFQIVWEARSSVSDPRLKEPTPDTCVSHPIPSPTWAM